MNKIDVDNDDVLSMEANTSLVGQETFKLRQLVKWINNYDRWGSHVIEQWLGDGVKSELLQPNGNGWQKGKVRIRFEFVPDEPEPITEPTPDSSDIVRSPQ